MEANMQHIDKNFKRSSCSWSSSPDLLDDLYLNKGKEVIPVLRVMAAHWFITRECLCTIGGFSPTFHHYGEDDNFLHRMYYRGLMIGIVPSLKVVHDRENRKMTRNQMIYMCNKSVLLLLSNVNISIFHLYFAIVALASIKSVLF